MSKEFLLTEQDATIINHLVEGEITSEEVYALYEEGYLTDEALVYLCAEGVFGAAAKVTAKLSDKLPEGSPVAKKLQGITADLHANEAQDQADKGEVEKASGSAVEAVKAKLKAKLK